jgi:Txe/YoeB family toxin of toxin-antitoxin system
VVLPERVPLNPIVGGVIIEGGKPELLKHDFHGFSSRRITTEHRLVYKVDETGVRIVFCRYHYT